MKVSRFIGNGGGVRKPRLPLRTLLRQAQCRTQPSLGRRLRRPIHFPRCYASSLLPNQLRMASASRTAPVVLLVLDGWGYRAEKEGNAIAMANVPTWDRLWARAPKTLLEASGEAVGLPCGQIGNSEVGHLNLGAGRVVEQDLCLL